MNKQLTYKQYESQLETMTFDEMHVIYDQLLEKMDWSNEELVERWSDVMQHAIAYTNVRAGWHALSFEEKVTKDPARTAAHNDFMFYLILFERTLKQYHIPTEQWTKSLFLQDEKEQRTIEDLHSHRQRIGDFANYLTFIYALNAR
ncbi:hypothetical protein [Atopobacter phocae]|uniref:hypothetical protein n=1 Tax=Atopobacter phocae TaxID=136492 RepID=UPI0004724415|nr:hypothetical protein [Atopobacter phocae]